MNLPPLHTPGSTKGDGRENSHDAGVTSEPSFAILAGAADSPVVFHVPHAARVVPGDARASIVLDDEQLTLELRHMTDAHTDLLAGAAAARVDPMPWQFVNRCSRLVVDPERFPDEREEMLAVGMGAVYTRTSHRRRLRELDPERDSALIERYFVPYAEALADLVDDRLSATGAAVILDIHSYPLLPLPYELHGDLPRPAICLGADQTHTPDWLVEAARGALTSVGQTAVNSPFMGTYVPLRHYERDRRVSSIMIEIRRDTYCELDGSLGAQWGTVASALGELARRSATLAV